MARRRDGKPFDHVNKVKEAQRGLPERIRTIKRRLSSPGLRPEERPELEAELGEASRLLDHSEKYVPQP